MAEQESEDKIGEKVKRDTTILEENESIAENQGLKERKSLEFQVNPAFNEVLEDDGAMVHNDNYQEYVKSTVFFLST